MGIYDHGSPFEVRISVGIEKFAMQYIYLLFTKSVDSNFRAF